MALPPLVKTYVESKLAQYCENRIPPHVRDKIKLKFKIRGNSVTLLEERPSFLNPNEWVSIVVAQFRFDPDTFMWTLYCADRNSRWHEYIETEPCKNLDDLLKEVDEDPIGVFWG